ncbi:MAG: esterase [Mucilaginibacter sp.]|nr:esterase [Mucilaginibacter sp.]
MKVKYLPLAFFTILCISCTTKKSKTNAFKIADIHTKDAYFKTDTLAGSSGNRIIPIGIYSNSADKNARRELVLLNVGYGGKNTDYGYIARNLALYGYFVVVIQHDLATDDTLPQTGDIYKLRRPFWDRGVRCIFYVTGRLKKEYPGLDYNHIILIGHSNGGDMAMLIANEYPDFAKIVITLDNRRMPIPRADHPKIFSIRSSDQPADPGVLPSAEEQKKYKIKIVKVNTMHNEMGGTATEAQKQEINTYILNYLKSLKL